MTAESAIFINEQAVYSRVFLQHHQKGGNTMYKQPVFRPKGKGKAICRSALSCDRRCRDKRAYMRSHRYDDPFGGNPLKTTHFDSVKERSSVAGRLAEFLRLRAKQ